MGYTQQVCVRIVLLPSNVWQQFFERFAFLRQQETDLPPAELWCACFFLLIGRYIHWPQKVKEAKTRHRVSLVSAHVTTLEEDLKQQPLCQDSPKDVLSDSGLEIELAIPFVPNRDPLDTPQQYELSEIVHYHPSE
ncbi:uncharacterized protein TNCV_2258861 [Trichonephila clavipes]|nr:uncharacterized protein TNCV_2258861 [Trichonephila clavipes]